MSNLWQRFKVFLSKNAPRAIANVINFLTMSFIALIRFIGTLIRDARS